jgi:hypothetical protein
MATGVGLVGQEIRDKEEINLFFLSRLTSSFSHDCYVDNSKIKHITELQITKSEQTNWTQMRDNFPTAAADFTDSAYI